MLLRKARTWAWTTYFFCSMNFQIGRAAAGTEKGKICLLKTLVVCWSEQDVEALSILFLLQPSHWPWFISQVLHCRTYRVFFSGPTPQIWLSPRPILNSCTYKILGGASSNYTEPGSNLGKCMQKQDQRSKPWPVWSWFWSWLVLVGLVLGWSWLVFVGLG